MEINNIKPESADKNTETHANVYFNKPHNNFQLIKLQ